MTNNKLRRATGEQMFFGVAAGIANYFNVDPVLIRLAFVILTLVSAGHGLLIYALLAIFMPKAHVTAKYNAFDEEEIVVHDVA